MQAKRYTAQYEASEGQSAKKLIWVWVDGVHVLALGRLSSTAAEGLEVSKKILETLRGILLWTFVLLHKQSGFALETNRLTEYSFRRSTPRTRQCCLRTKRASSARANLRGDR